MNSKLKEIKLLRVLFAFSEDRVRCIIVMQSIDYNGGFR